MAKLRAWIDKTFYSDCGDNWDDELFRRRLLKEIGPESRILDLGAGAGIVPQMDFSNHAASVCGIDPDEAVMRNPYLDEARVASGEAIPYPDSAFDLVFADNVLEHLEDPVRVFREVRRVLAPGGLFLVKTPNRWHYVPLIARLTPHQFHEWFNRRRGRRGESDIFPTLYRANSRRQIARCAEAAGLDLRELTRHEGRPEYLRFSAPSYLSGLLYERLVNAMDLLAAIRVVIVGVLAKPSAG